MRQLEMEDRLDLLICIVNNFTQLDVVADAHLLEPELTPERKEVERQTQSFLQNVYQPLVTLILELSLPPIIHMLSTLLHRGDLVSLVGSRVRHVTPPCADLMHAPIARYHPSYQFIRQVENIKQNIVDGVEVPLKT